MSFGFSVGDFIAISRLILTLADALDSDTGSRAQYSRLSDELKSLHSAFLAVQDVVQKLRRDEKSHASTINAITFELECCRKLILGFNANTAKYRESLYHGGSGRQFKDAWRKISYKIFREEDVVMLKDSLGRRVATINILLQVAGKYDMFLFHPRSCSTVGGSAKLEGSTNRPAFANTFRMACSLSAPVHRASLWSLLSRGIELISMKATRSSP